MSTANAPLSPRERAEIAALAAPYPVPRAACIDALKFLQAERGYISDTTLAAAAEALAMPVAELDEVATFYNLIFRQPVGKNVLLLCDSITCWMLGRDDLAAQITRALGIRPGETTQDGKITLLPTVCLGACDRAPALLEGETLHGCVTPESLSALLEKLVTQPA
jgi:NADH-quinone oxidoreductase subunit E